MNAILRIRMPTVATSVVRIQVVGTPVVRIPVVGTAVVRIILCAKECQQ